MINTAEGALEEITDMLQRMRELAVQQVQARPLPVIERT